MVSLTTERLLLRHIHLLDGGPLERVFGDEEVMRFGDGVQTSAWVQGWLRMCLEHYQRWGFGPYAVVERRRREVIGYCGLFFFPELDGQPEVEVGYRLARAWWGHGYATEAARAVCGYAFNVLCIRRIIAMIDPQNAASIRVAEKLGMRYEKPIMLEGYTHPDYIYALEAKQQSPSAN